MGILLSLGALIFLYVFAKVLLKEPILPWKENTVKKPKSIKPSKKNTEAISMEEDVKLFQDFIKEVGCITHHMLRLKDDTFQMFIKVNPVNYDLLSQQEQESIDSSFETWLSTLEVHSRWYFQNRFIDYSEPIQQMRKNMKNAENLPDSAIEYGETMINELDMWQRSTPRYDTHRFLLFSTKVNPSKITADSEEEFDQKLIDRAFSELYRNFNSSKNSLKKAKIDLEIVPSEGIVEILYHAFNRRRSVKTKFKDIVTHEHLAEYVTADQEESRIELVKEMIDNHVQEKEQEQETGEQFEESIKKVSEEKAG